MPICQKVFLMSKMWIIFQGYKQSVGSLTTCKSRSSSHTKERLIRNQTQLDLAQVVYLNSRSPLVQCFEAEVMSCAWACDKEEAMIVSPA